MQQRWLVLAIFSGLTLINALIWLTFAPISKLSQTFFDKSAFQINLFAIAYLIMYVPGSFIAARLINKFGVRGATITAAVAQTLAAALRFGAVTMSAASPYARTHAVYYIVLGAQLLSGFAQPVFSNNPSRIAATWFPSHQRVMATTIASLSNPIGIALGQLLPGLFVKEQVPQKPGDPPCDFMFYLCLQLGAAALFSLLAIFFFSEKPPTAPSRSQHSRLFSDSSLRHTTAAATAAAAAAAAAAVGARAEAASARASSSETVASGPSIAAGSLSVGPDHLGPAMAPASSLGNLQGASAEDDAVLAASAAGAGDDPTSLLSAYFALLKIGQFRVLLFSFGLGLAAFNAIVTLTEQIVAPCGGGAHAGKLGAVTILAGLVGSRVIGPVLELTKEFKPVLKTGFSMAAVATVVFCGLLHLTEDKTWLLYVLFALLGLFMLPLLPVTLETAVECTYPAREELSAGLLMMFGQIPAISLILLLTWCIEQKEFQECSRPYISPFAATLVGVVVTAVIGVYVYDGPYRRQAVERMEGSAEDDMDIDA